MQKTFVCNYKILEFKKILILFILNEYSASLKQTLNR